MRIVFGQPALPDADTVCVAALEGTKLTASGRTLDSKAGRGLARAIKAARFTGKKGEGASVLAPPGTGLDRVYVFGLGKPKAIDAKCLQNAGGRIYEALAKSSRSVTVAVDPIQGCSLTPAEMAAEIAFGLRLKSYRFDKYRTKEKKEEKPTFKSAKLVCEGSASARRLFSPKDKIADGVFFTRDLVAEPPNVLYPETLARQARTLTRLGVKVEILGEAEMRKLGMGALVGVGQGSARDSRLAVMRWNGTRRRGSARGSSKRRTATAGPLAFVGKGVTFDTGGISLKPSAGMQDMKWDMGGAGAVIGLMKALAGRKANVDAVGVVGLVENMPGGNAQRPGDVVKSMSGQTIEIQNTDAEGRLVLADALWYCKERFKPRFMIDLATLTGAILVSLGQEMAGMFSNDDELCRRLSAAGEAVGEAVWRMPLGDEYDKMIKSDIADMKNIGGRWGGSITAAQFLQRFVDKTPWVHLDIAGMAWSDKATPVRPKGGTGYGVRLLDRLIADFYEGN
ncbi:MAG: leucyl aminopeptidase [Rhodospirillales bacterium]|jgi:leucyl aminopeptidase|nr:leucyl aminopeptidase [Rhodospirillales bacterium]